MRVDRVLDDLRHAGLPVAPGEVACDSESAVKIASRMGFPVVLKACALDHKSDRGGVVVGLADEMELHVAVGAMQDDLGEDADSLLVQRHVRGVEVLVGARREPNVAAVLVVGAGGVNTELLQDMATTLLPLRDGDALAMLQRLRMYPLLVGYRGRDLCDVHALVQLIEATGRYVFERKEIAELDLNPVVVGANGEGAVIVDARLVESRVHLEEHAGDLDLAPLFDPQHVVVVGVSDDPSKTGSRIFRNLLKHGFAGRVDAVHPDGGQIDGHKRFRNLEEVPGIPDLVSIAVPSNRVEEVVESAAKIGVGSVIVHSSGFAETGHAGSALQDRLASLLCREQIPFVGPNDMGIVCPGNSLAASLSGGLDSPLIRGSIALVSSSGALGSCLATRLMCEGHGLSRWIHLGNEAGLDAADYITWLARDPETAVVGLLLESIADGNRLVDACHSARSEGKPVFAYTMGRTAEGREAVATHTGALLGSDRLLQAVLERAGVVEVPTLQALEDVLVLSSTAGLPRCNRLAAITASGGACTIIADVASDSDLELPSLPGQMVEGIKRSMPGFATVRNPIDLTAQLLGDASTFASVLDILCDESVFDLVLVALTTNADPGAEAIAHAVVACQKRVGIPIFVSRYGAPAIAPRALAVYKSSGIVVLDAPDRAVQAVAALVRSIRVT